MTKNELVFKQIREYSYTIHAMAENIKVSRTYKGDSKLRIVPDGTRLIYKNRFATFRLTIDEIKSINNGAAYEIILEILSELELNNPLWKCNGLNDKGRLNSQYSAGLRVLEKHGIIIPFRGTHVYYVMPTKLSCGDPLKVAFAWLQYVQDYNIKPDMIGELPITKLPTIKDNTYIVDILKEFLGHDHREEGIPS